VSRGGTGEKRGDGEDIAEDAGEDIAEVAGEDNGD